MIGLAVILTLWEDNHITFKAYLFRPLNTSLAAQETSVGIDSNYYLNSSSHSISLSLGTYIGIYRAE